MRATALATCALLLLLGASGCGEEGARLVLDGSPRVPDDEGLVTEVELDRITLDGDRSYDVDEDLRSFSALDLSTVPLLFSDGQYVQVGVEDGAIVWIGAIARPVGVDPPRVYFTDVVAAVGEVEGEQAVTFGGGTVLRLLDDVTGVAPGALLRAEVDVEQRAVRSVAVLEAAPGS